VIKGVYLATAVSRDHSLRTVSPLNSKRSYNNSREESDHLLRLGGASYKGMAKQWNKVRISKREL
jgi:hypothetical protein